MSTKKAIIIAVITVVTSLMLFSACVAALSDGPSLPASQGVESSQGLEAEPAYKPTQSPVVEESQVTAVQGGETATDNGVSVLSEPLRLQKGTIGSDKYFCSLITMENGSSASVSYNIFYWNLKNPEGYESNIDVFGSNKMLGSGDLSPGSKVKGDVCFKFDSIQSGQYTLTLQALFGDGPEMQWVHQVG